jgi:hypothetical protein
MVICVSDAVDRQRGEQTFLAAIQGFESAVREIAMAVVDGVAAGICGDEERLVPIAVEQRS